MMARLQNRLLRELLTTQPMRRIFVVINAWWAFILSLQPFYDRGIASWYLLQTQAPGWFWITLWWTLTALAVAGVLRSTRSLMRSAAMLTAIAWFFNGWFLSQYDRVLLPLTGFSFIFSFMALWSFIRIGHVTTTAVIIAGPEGSLNDWPYTERRRAGTPEGGLGTVSRNSTVDGA